MRAVIVCGSANPSGTTAAMCRSAERSFLEHGWEAESVFPGGMDIRHCTGCGGCRDGPCVIGDDMCAVLEAVGSADMVVLASPIQFSGPSSLTSTVMSRFQPYWTRGKKHEGRMAAMLCGGSPAPRFHCAVYMMRAFSVTLGMAWEGHLEVPGTDEEGFALPEEKIRRFVEGLVRT